MAVSLPPWLNLDPIEPARIRQQAIAQRNAANAQAADLQFRREQLAANTAAQERAEERRDRVFQQTQDQELAIAAANMQMRREAQAEQARQFQENLRLKQQEAEREAKLAAQQMQGMDAVRKGLEAGVPLQKLIADNAPLLFARHPERIPTAVPKGVTGPVDLVARELMDESGRPLGVRVIPGQGGSQKFLPRTEITPEGRLRADQLRLGVINRQLEEADPSSPEFDRLTKSRDAIMDRLEQITSRRGAALPDAGATPLGTQAAAAPSDMVQVISPRGDVGMMPRANLEAAKKKGYKEITAKDIPVAADEEEALDEEE